MAISMLKIRRPWGGLTLHWHHNDHDGVSNHQPHGCLLNRFFRCRSKQTSKPRVTGLCAGNSPGPVNSPRKGPVTRKMFPFDDVIMIFNMGIAIPGKTIFLFETASRLSTELVWRTNQVGFDKRTTLSVEPCTACWVRLWPVMCSALSHYLNQWLNLWSIRPLGTNLYKIWLKIFYWESANENKCLHQGDHFILPWLW